MSDGNKIKKAIVINGSPKKENSCTLGVTRAFVKGLNQTVPLDCEYINVTELKVKPCRGCLSCWGRTEGECVIRDDDMLAVKNKIKAADYVIESYPLYFFGMPGEMKVFTDRLLGMMSTYTGNPPASGKSVHGIRNHRDGQKFIVISSCAYSDAEFVYDALLKQYDFICGKGNYTAILCPQLFTLDKLGAPARTARYLKKFEDAGRDFGTAGELNEARLKALAHPPFSEETYKVLLDKFWQGQRSGEKDKNGADDD